MPKDEFDFNDPMELSGVGLLTATDTTRDMAECFAEEFMRLRYTPLQILALFRNVHYLGPNLVYQRHGEAFVREVIAESFARWGRDGSEVRSQNAEGRSDEGEGPSPQHVEFDARQCDPTGAPLPKLSP